MNKIVVKVGTSTITQGTKKLSRRVMLELTRQLATLHEQKKHIILVTSGAIGAGRELLAHPATEHSLPTKQMLAAVGQVELMRTWSELFSLFDIHVAQVLLTREDFSHRDRYLNAIDTMSCLLSNNVVPIVNENDTVATQEIRVGDNDNLAALVANLVGAELLILLTDQEGLFTSDPRLDSHAKLIPIVTHIDETVFKLAKGSSSTLGTGGMTTKIEAAQIAGRRGIATIVASSAHPNVLIEINEGKHVGTKFLPEIKAPEESSAATIWQIAQRAKDVSHEMAMATTEQKNGTLKTIAQNLKAHQTKILAENLMDIEHAKQVGLSESLIDRLSLQQRLDGIIEDLKKVIALPDPVGEHFEQQILPNKLEIEKCRTPLGVLGIIYESRPNVTIDISGLTIKSGNCAILRGGSECLRTNNILGEIIRNALKSNQLPADAVQLVTNPSRDQVTELLQAHEYIDLIIPRGGAELHNYCRENSKIPVITGGIGICHLFVDESADLERSIPLIVNAKTQRPTVCNALDTLLVHESIANTFIPKVIQILHKKGVRFRVDSTVLTMLDEREQLDCKLATPEDWDTEWLSLVMGIKIVKDIDDAIAHIILHSTEHSDGILTDNENNAQRFIKEIDSAAVYVNASTRFTDGGQLGLGAEVAVSTQKLHARGPMGLKELTSYKWIIRGEYAVRK